MAVLPEHSHPTAEVRQADEICQAKMLYGEIVQSERRDLKRAYELGKLLISIKSNVAHGNWTTTLEKTGIPARTAQQYMRIGKSAALRISTFNSISQALGEIKELEDDIEQGYAEDDFFSGSGTGEGGNSEESEQETAQLSPDEFCARCIRIGKPVKDCKACKALREKADDDDEKEDEPLKDDGGREVPERLLPVFQAIAIFKLAARRAATTATALEQAEATEAYADLQRVAMTDSPKGLKRIHSTEFKTAAVRMTRTCPSMVCPKCEGEPASDDNESCSRCDGKGWLAKMEVKDK